MATYCGLEVKGVKLGSIPIQIEGDTNVTCWGREEKISSDCATENLAKRVIKRVLQEHLSECCGVGEEVFIERLGGDSDDAWKSGWRDNHWERNHTITIEYDVATTKNDEAYIIPMRLTIVRFIYVDKEDQRRSYDRCKVEEVKYEVHKIIGGPEALKSWKYFSRFSKLEVEK